MSNHRHISHENVDAEGYVSDLFLNDYPKFIGSQINCVSLGKVNNYSKSKHTCDVQLLPLKSNVDKNPTITEVVVPISITEQDDFNQKIASKLSIPYNKKFKVGCVVTVGFFDRELDNFKNNADNYKIETDRMHSLNDAVVLGVINHG